MFRDTKWLTKQYTGQFHAWNCPVEASTRT
ncbi:hypothetical protein EV643_1603 [Kribbella sp. VKM Ac-2527]|jgi:hypothetical protein|uniref:Uncharacterized protein n=1 Tax=Kribbella caucasensis TaxID=2512215 RepID=A0A4R6IYI0_9ACTN|nr:hypothetical protein EV643_1603 [Kribbella sp. VKM Ac-2527]